MPDPNKPDISLEQIFKAYSQKFIEVVQNPKYDETLSEQVKLEFYGLYKFSLEGPCNLPKPSMFQFEKKAKYEAWKNLSDENNSNRILSKTEAQLAYIEKFKELFPEEIDSIDLQNIKNTMTFELGNMGTFGGQNVYGRDFAACSAALNVAGAGKNDDTNLPNFSDNKLSTDAETNLFLKLVQEDNLEAIKVMYENNPDVILLRDSDGNSCLHWAADRCSNKFLFEFLIKDKILILDSDSKNKKFDVNWQNNFGETALHLANELDIFECLVKEFRIDKSIEDKEGYVAEM